MTIAPGGVLTFWFEDTRPEQHFQKDPDFDRLIAGRFGNAHERAARGEHDHWQGDPAGSLALLVLLDQFPRNMFRDTPRAFATDAKALAVAKAAVARGHDLALPARQRKFFYLPYEHSEILADQEEAVRLMTTRCPQDEQAIGYARRHRDVIVRFGRFPHRNAILGRKSTTEEAAFLQQRGSSF